MFSVDVVEEEFYGAFLLSPQEALLTLKGQHPQQTQAVGACRLRLSCAKIEVPLDPSGTYADGLREFLRGLGCAFTSCRPSAPTTQPRSTTG